MPLLNGEASRETAGERRAAVCLKACEGIPTELLARGFILRLIAACVHVEDGRVREALEELVRHRLNLVDGRSDAKRRSNAAPRGQSISARGDLTGS